MPETGEADIKKKKEEAAQLREKQKKSLSEEKEIDIHIKYSPRKILKGGIIIALLVVAFALGRMTAVPSASEPAVQHSSSFGSFFSNLFSGKSTGEAIKEPKAVPAEENQSAKAAPVENATLNNNTASAASNSSESAPASDSTSEKVITKYNNVVATLNDVTVDWKGTWGKITEIDYNIKNNEQGTIKPDYFIMTMEGYTDFEKKIPVTSTIAAGKSDAAIVLVPGGFSYNNATAGDLTNVEISLVLYDADKKAMASFKQEFNLKRG